MIVTREFTVGDRLMSLLADLYYQDGSPVILGVAETILFRMVTRDGTVKVDDAAAEVVSRGDAVADTPARVRYDWATADVDTAGTYVGWFIRVSSGETEHFPTHDRATPEFRVVFRSDS